MFTKENTNVCKGFAIILLLFHHFPWAQEVSSGQLSSSLSAVAVGARVCVWVFVFLSAYGISYKYLNLKNKNYFVLKQWLSLMMPFWFLYVLILPVCFVMGHSFDEIYSGNVVYLLLDFMGVSDLFGTGKAVGVFWYMCLAQMILFIVPLIISLSRKFGYLTIILAFIVSLFLNDSIVTYNGGSYLDYLPAVVIGVVFAERNVMNRLSSFFSRPFFQVTGFTICMLAAILLMISREALINDNICHIKGMLSSVSAVAICVGFGVFVRLKLFVKPLAFIGSYSGTMFIIHALFLFVLKQYIFIFNNAFLDFVILFLVSLIVSILLNTFRKLVGYDKLLSIIFKKI